jgi:Tfp pilus assembly protein PilW
MTLLEFITAIGIGSILVIGIAALSITGARSFLIIGNFADMDADSRQAVDLLGQELRQASAVLSVQTNLPVKSLSVTNSTLNRVSTLAWDSQARTLTLTRGQAVRVLLNECDFWEVKLFQRTPNLSGTTASFNIPAPPADCKVIDLSWRCSRTNQGQQLNTESLQRSVIVIRNKVK